MKNVEKVIKSLLEGVDRVLLDHQELREEFELMFKRSLDDRPMALGRARRLLEVLVVDEYIRAHNLKPPYGKQLKPLFEMIKDLSDKGTLTKIQQNLCHAVRIEGNAAVHYKPDGVDDRIRHDVEVDRMMDTFLRLCQVLEELRGRGCQEKPSFYLQSLPPMFRKLYSSWQKLADRTEMAAYKDCIEMLLRSMFASLREEDLQLLLKVAPGSPLPIELTRSEEHSYRRLRNAGAITHDGEWLFTPTRSTHVKATTRGKFFGALWWMESVDQPRRGADSDALAAGELALIVKDVEDLTNGVMNNPKLSKTLQTVQTNGGSLESLDRVSVRELRNLLLVAHEDDLLASATTVHITDLGYYILGAIDQS